MTKGSPEIWLVPIGCPWKKLHSFFSQRPYYCSWLFYLLVRPTAYLPGTLEKILEQPAWIMSEICLLCCSAVSRGKIRMEIFPGRLFFLGLKSDPSYIVPKSWHYQERNRNIFLKGQTHFSWFFSLSEMLFPVENFHFGRPKTNFSGLKKKKKKKKKSSPHFVNFYTFHFQFSTFPFTIFLLLFFFFFFFNFHPFSLFPLPLFSR